MVGVKAGFGQEGGSKMVPKDDNSVDPDAGSAAV